MSRRVAIYARVSTEHEAQLSALDNQVQYYDNLLKIHPEWILYKQYIDEGITGTSVNKRKAFTQMLEDARDGKFDLIVTREVSRFARNTVDTLQETRKLKKIGVEVYFTEDNIWTMNDEDGELRLTIMATLAQNESKKTSLRVRAGQRISFENAVPYGNGNILGYERVNKKYVINPEQAKTVRLIYDMYLAGQGTRNIQFELEKRKCLTAAGNTTWHTATISHILGNPFYCGTIVYRKQYVTDYLEQKKINNYGEVEQIVVEGEHEPIVTKEEFQKVQAIKDTKKQSVSQRGRRGEKPPKYIWCKKLRCSCGSAFNRKVWTKLKDGTQKYCYQCYSAIRHGTYGARKARGLSVDGICDIPMIQQWKLDLIVRTIMKMLCEDKKNVLNIANKILEDCLNDHDDSEERLQIQDLQNKIKRLSKKKENLLDLRLSDAISKEEFIDKRADVENEISELERQKSELMTKISSSPEEIDNKLQVLQCLMDQKVELDEYTIPEAIIDALIDEVIVYKDKFVIKLAGLSNEKNDLIACFANSKEVVGQTPYFVNGSTGCYSTEEVIFI